MTAIDAEIQRFNRLSATWWDPQGPMRPLHVVNALRLDYVMERVAQHFGQGAVSSGLQGLRVLDVGCGAGLLSEPLAQRGAQVVGVDASRGNIEAARLHAAERQVHVDYRLGEPADVLGADERFDVVLALEVVEHVSDVPAFLQAAAQRLAPGGLLLVSTIDRTLKSFVFAIVGAEYVLRVLPRGTHRWRQFVRPAEVSAALQGTGLRRVALTGMQYNPWRHSARWCPDTRVNYIAAYARA
jgi:2-polyprenyl-6-hydroxyphenyl methylase/3-demethylubiquinone-9 3-methyltransferase